MNFETNPDNRVNDLISAEQVMEDNEFAARFTRMMEHSKKRDRLFADWIATQCTQPRPCQRHPDVLTDVDRQQTLFSSNGNPGRWALVFYGCPVCAQNEQLRRSNVPPVLVDSRFENFLPENEGEEEIVDKVREFTQKRVGFLVMIGGVGTGKSHLAVAAMRSFKRTVFVKQSTLLLMLRETYHNKRAANPVDLCQRADLLVLDELGLTSGGRDELPMLHEILDHRYGARKPTILTCNIGLDQLRDVLGERMLDRLRECAFGVLSFAGKSHRVEAKTRYFEGNTEECDVRLWWESSETCY